jgi:hypothetical protein
MRYKLYTKSRGWYYIALKPKRPGIQMSNMNIKDVDHTYEQLSIFSLHRNNIRRVRVFNNTNSWRPVKNIIKFPISEDSPWFNFDIYKVLIKEYDMENTSQAYTHKILDKLSNEI